MSGGALLQAALYLGVLAVLGRFVAPLEFGAFNFALAAVLIAGLTAELGLEAALVQRRELTREHIGVGVTVALVAGAAVALALFLAAPLARIAFGLDDAVLALRALAPTVVFTSLAAVPAALLQRRLAFRTVAASRLGGYIIGYGLVGVGLAIGGAGLSALIAAQFVQSLTYCCLLIVAGGLPAPRFRVEALRELLAFGAPLTVAQLANATAQRADELIVGAGLGASMLGFYGRAYQIMNLPANMFSQAAEKVMFSALATVQDEEDRLRSAFLRTSGLTALVLLPTAVLVFIVAEEVVLVLLGPGWEGVVPALRVFSVALFFRTAYKVGGTVLRALGVVHLLAGAQIAYAGLVVAGATVGLPHGITGVAVGTSVAVGCHFLVLSGSVVHRLRIPVRQLLKSHLAGMLMALVGGTAVWLVAAFLRNTGASPYTVVGVTALTGGTGFLLLISFAPLGFAGEERNWWSAAFRQAFVQPRSHEDPDIR